MPRHTIVVAASGGWLWVIFAAVSSPGPPPTYDHDEDLMRKQGQFQRRRVIANGISIVYNVRSRCTTPDILYSL